MGSKEQWGGEAPGETVYLSPSGKFAVKFGKQTFTGDTMRELKEIVRKAGIRGWTPRSDMKGFQSKGETEGSETIYLKPNGQLGITIRKKEYVGDTVEEIQDKLREAAKKGKWGFVSFGSKEKKDPVEEAIARIKDPKVTRLRNMLGYSKLQLWNPTDAEIRTKYANTRRAIEEKKKNGNALERLDTFYEAYMNNSRKKQREQAATIKTLKGELESAKHTEYEAKELQRIAEKLMKEAQEREASASAAAAEAGALARKAEKKAEDEIQKALKLQVQAATSRNAAVKAAEAKAAAAIAQKEAERLAAVEAQASAEAAQRTLEREKAELETAKAAAVAAKELADKALAEEKAARGTERETPAARAAAAAMADQQRAEKKARLAEERVAAKAAVNKKHKNEGMARQAALKAAQGEAKNEEPPSLAGFGFNENFNYKYSKEELAKLQEAEARAREAKARAELRKAKASEADAIGKEPLPESAKELFALAKRAYPELSNSSIKAAIRNLNDNKRYKNVYEIANSKNILDKLSILNQRRQIGENIALLRNPAAATAAATPPAAAAALDFGFGGPGDGSTSPPVAAAAPAAAPAPALTDTTTNIYLWKDSRNQYKVIIKTTSELQHPVETEEQGEALVKYLRELFVTGGNYKTPFDKQLRYTIIKQKINQFTEIIKRFTKENGADRDITGEEAVKILKEWSNISGIASPWLGSFIGIVTKALDKEATPFTKVFRSAGGARRYTRRNRRRSTRTKSRLTRRRLKR